MISRRLIVFLSLVTAIGVFAYWTLVFTGLFPVADRVPGYQHWFMSFPLADAWIGSCALLTVIMAWRHRPQITLFGLLTGSGLIFLGLYALAYGINTRLLFTLTTDEIIEIGIKIYCLSVGSILIIGSWCLRPAETKMEQVHG